MMLLRRSVPLAMNKFCAGATILIMLLFLPVSFSYAGLLAEREVLNSGIVLLHAEKKAVPIIKVVMAVKAGSIAEPSERPGLANLTAELLNEGTTRRSSAQISEAIEFVGGSLHASGGTDYMTVSLSILKKDADLGFDLLSDVMLRPAFSEDEIRRKKRLLKNAIRQQLEDPGTIAAKAFQKAVFGEHPYGRPNEGTEESLELITREDILAFFRETYIPGNTTIAVSGDISREELKTLLEKYFGKWKSRAVRHQLPLTVAKESEPRVIKISKELKQANILLGHTGINRDNPDYYAVSVMNYILGGGGFASRLMDNIRDNRGLAYSVYSHFAAQKHGGSFQVGLQTKNESANTAITEILSEMKRLQSEPVGEAELRDAKAYLTGSFPLKLDSNSKIAGFLIAVEVYGLGLDYVDKYKDYISRVTKEDILRVAKRYLHPENYVLVVVGDLGKAALKY